MIDVYNSLRTEKTATRQNASDNKDKVDTAIYWKHHWKISLEKSLAINIYMYFRRESTFAYCSLIFLPRSYNIICNT